MKKNTMPSLEVPLSEQPRSPSAAVPSASVTSTSAPDLVANPAVTEATFSYGLLPAVAEAADVDGNEPGKLFIGGLSQATTELSLRAHFSQFGQLESAVVMMDSQSGRSRGFGFVKFKDLAGAVAALEWGRDSPQLDGKEVDVKQSNIRVRGSRAVQMRHLKVFVGGIAPEVDAFALRMHFSQYGRILDVNLMLDPARQRHRGFAFITFEDGRVVQHLVQLRFINMGGRLVEVKTMKPPGGSSSTSVAALKATLQLQHQHQQHQQLHLPPNNNQQAQLPFLLHHFQQQQPAAHPMTATSRSLGGTAPAASSMGPSVAMPLLTSAAFCGCPPSTATVSATSSAISSWQPVAFDPESAGLTWARAAIAWPDHHQQQQLHHHYQHHLSIFEYSWLTQPLQTGATAASAWPNLLSLRAPRDLSQLIKQQAQPEQQQQQHQQQQQQQQQHQHQNQQHQQQQQQQQQQHQHQNQQQQLYQHQRQDSDATSCRLSFNFTTSSSGGSKDAHSSIGVDLPLPHQLSQQQQHQHHHQQQYQHLHQQHQHLHQQRQLQVLLHQWHEQQEQSQILLQTTAAGDFGERSALD